jgi:DNA-directed RNA polymerase
MYYDLKLSKNKRYKYHIFVIPETLKIVINQIIADSHYVPMIIPPIDWDVSLNNGGYLTYKETFISSKSYQKSTPKLSQSFVNGVNRLQKTSFRINYELLCKLLESKDIREEDYFQEANKIEFDLLQLYYGQKVKDFKTETENITKTPSRYKRMSIDELSNYFKNSQQNTLKELALAKEVNRNSFLNIIRTFINLGILLCKYNIKDYYLPIKLDSRGRMYNSGFLNPVNNKLLRNLMILDETISFNYSKEVDDISMYYLNFQECKQKGMTTYDYKPGKIRNPVSYFCADKGELVKQTVQFDATASMLQILAILTRDKKLMQLTNVVYTDTERIQDPYEYVITHMNLDMDGDNELKKTIFKLSTQRSMVKGVLMRYIYGAGDKGIHSFIKTLYPGILKDDCKWIRTKIIKCFNTLFPTIHKLQLFFKAYSRDKYKKKVPLGYTVGDNYYETIYYESNYKKLENFEITNYKGDEIKITLRYKAVDDTHLNLMKYSTSLLPNYIHSLDGYIAYNTRLALLDQQISCFSIHDCFLVRSDRVENLITEYNKQLIKLLDINLLKVFPMDMKTPLGKKYGKWLEKLRIVNIDTESILKSKYSLIQQ